MFKSAANNILNYKKSWDDENSQAQKYRTSYQGTMRNAAGLNPNSTKQNSQLTSGIGNLQQYKKHSDAAKGYSQAAKQYYDTLRKNGENAVADYLENNGYENSKNFINSYYNGNKYDAKQTAYDINALKKKWDTLTAAGDTAGAQAAAASAQGLYALMRKNGDDVMANNLENKGYDDANNYLKSYYSIQGLSPTRSYLYSLGTKMGLSNRDIDNQLKYDDRTGEVYFGGKSLGKTQANVDGVSYYDSDTLNSAFNDYVNRAGITAPKEQLAQQLWQNLVGNYKDYYDNMVKENPYTNEVGKSILSKYDLAGYTAGNNAAASGAASNGGNIDSFAAGNAMRNQAALIAMGQEKALAAQNQKLERARDILANMGVDAEKIFNASETEKNNDVTRNATIADVTGYTPEQWTYTNNPYLNGDGTLRNENLDYKAIIEDARTKLNSEKDENQRKRLNDIINYASQARGIKLGDRYNADGRYTQYDDGDYVYTPPRTKDVELHYADNDLTKYGYDKDAETSKYIVDSNERQNNVSAETNKEIAKAGYASQEQINRDTIAGNQKQLNTTLAAQSAENKAQREHDQKLLETQLGIDSNTGTADVKVSDFVNTINTIYGKDTISTNDKGKYVVNDNYKYKVLVAIQNMKNVSNDTKNGLRDALDI